MTQGIIRITMVIGTSALDLPLEVELQRDGENILSVSTCTKMARRK
jgi:hypothetical protein